MMKGLGSAFVINGLSFGPLFMVLALNPRGEQLIIAAAGALMLSISLLVIYCRLLLR